VATVLRPCLGVLPMPFSLQQSAVPAAPCAARTAIRNARSCCYHSHRSAAAAPGLHVSRRPDYCKHNICAGAVHNKVRSSETAQ
jgi:hypothetical protein